MAKVIVTKMFPGVEDGQVYGRNIVVGEVIDGDLGDVALREGWAKLADDAESLQTKAVVDDGRKPDDENNEITLAVLAIADDWRTFNEADLLALAEKIYGQPVADVAEAQIVIETEVTNRAELAKAAAQ